MNLNGVDRVSFGVNSGRAFGFSTAIEGIKGKTELIGILLMARLIILYYTIVYISVLVGLRKYCIILYLCYKTVSYAIINTKHVVEG